MFYILDYRALSKKGWGTEIKEPKIESLFKVLSMNMDKESYDAKEKVHYYKCGVEANHDKGSKWMVKFNVIRSNIDHTGSRNKANGVNKSELRILNLMYNGLERVGP